jgi:hypothetical protein
LTRLGLSDLRLRHLERSVAGELDGNKRQELGRRLADAYAERLMAAADDPQVFASLKARIDELLRKMPQAGTPALSVMLLQADFQRAETLMTKWLDGADAAASADRPTPAAYAPALPPVARQPPAEAVEILSRIVPELTRRAKELANLADKVLAATDDRGGADNEEIEQAAYRLQAVAARASYFAGWGHYYLGLSRPTADAASADFTSAKQFFSDVLGVSDAMDYAPVEVESLGLESVWRARTAIGLGLAESALGRSAAAAACFRWLDHASAPANLRDQAAYWQVTGLINVRRLKEAAELAEIKVQSLASPPTAGKNSLCVALIRAGAEQANAADGETRAAARRLVLLGITKLARLRQFDTLGQLVSKHNLDQIEEARSGFYLTWLAGREKFLAAEKSRSKDEFHAAAKSLQAALAHDDAKRDLFAAGHCRYLLAWSQFRLEDFESAAPAFQEVVPALREGDPELAVQANWMEFAAWQALAEKKKDPRMASAAVSALKSLKRDFPGTPQAAKADIYIARLQQNVSPQEAIDSLEAVKPGEPSYLAARYEIVQLRLALWRQSAGKGGADELAAALQADVDRFLAAASGRSMQDERLKACLALVEVLTSQARVDDALVAKYLVQAAGAAESLSSSSPLLAEFQYRRLQHAQRTGDETALREAAEWIAANAAGTPYELPSLVIVARHADQAVEAADASQKRARQEQAARIYERLVALLGDSPQVLTATKNALAASSRLAGYDEALGRWKEAAARLDKIVAAFPSDKKYLRRAGIAHFQAGNHPAALVHWRKLLAGLTAGSEEWLEAKYYQLASLSQTDRSSALQVHKQFKILYPEVKSPAWKEKFAALERELGAN